MDLEQLRKFLIESNMAGYASGKEKEWINESNRSTTIPFTKGDWRVDDNFFGGEPYGGRLVVFYKEKPVWIMVYYGWVEQEASTDHVYRILREALKSMPKDAPFRGPEQLDFEEMNYTNSWSGDISRYSGHEKIEKDGLTLYEATYLGGLVDQCSGL